MTTFRTHPALGRAFAATTGLWCISATLSATASIASPTRQPVTATATAAQPIATAGSLSGSIQPTALMHTIVVAGTKALNTLDALPTEKQIFNSTQSIKVIGRKQIATAGPAAGATQVLAIAPGVNSSTDSPAGATRGSISVNGMKTGWSGAAGNGNDGTVMVTFDGVPMVDPAYAVWGTDEIPNMAMIKGVSVTYGPGYPVNRWFENIGGSVNFVPLQPTGKPGATVGAYYGSFASKGVNFSLRSGQIDGWSAIIAGGSSNSANYLRGYGFNNPSSSYAYYFKIRHRFPHGHFSVGAYIARSSGYRPVNIPVHADPGGPTVNGVLISQETTGFYTTLPYSMYWKKAINKSYIIYSKFANRLSRGINLHNLMWFRRGMRQHLHSDPTYSTNQQSQYYSATNDTYGDKLYLSAKLPRNTVTFGGYFINNSYYSLLDFWTPGEPATSLDGQGVDVNDLEIGESPAPSNLYYSFNIPWHFHSNNLYITDLAAFIQDNIRPMRNLRITPGVRFVTFKTSYNSDVNSRWPLNVQYDLGGNNGDYFLNSSTAFSRVEPSIGANWKALPYLSVYANVSRSYAATSGASGTYAHYVASSLQPQASTQYQIGLKSYIPHDGLLNHALIGINYYHLTDTHERLAVSLANGTNEFASGSSVFQGENMYFDDDPLRHLHVFANVSLEKANYSNYRNSQGSYNGLPVANVPAQTANVGVFYEWQRSFVRIDPRLWWSYTGAQTIFNNYTNKPSSTKLPAYGIWNAALRLRVARHDVFDGLHHFTVSFDVLNLLGKQYNAFEYRSGGGFGLNNGQLAGTPGAPRTYYMSVAARFG